MGQLELSVGCFGNKIRLMGAPTIRIEFLLGAGVVVVVVEVVVVVVLLDVMRF